MRHGLAAGVAHQRGCGVALGQGLLHHQPAVRPMVPNMAIRIRRLALQADPGAGLGVADLAREARTAANVDVVHSCQPVYSS